MLHCGEHLPELYVSPPVGECVKRSYCREKTIGMT